MPSPEHLFKIGDQGVCGVLAGQRGLIAQYAADYPNINYLVKMNSKTNLVKTAQEDPYSPQLYDLEAVLAMRDNGVNIVGLGYTIYLGSEYESTMMAEAGRAPSPRPTPTACWSCCGSTRAARPSRPRRTRRSSRVRRAWPCASAPTS